MLEAFETAVFGILFALCLVFGIVLIGKFVYAVAFKIPELLMDILKVLTGIDSTDAHWHHKDDTE